jgi:ribosomal protein S18 acetylase RimI-like enzyme
VSAPSEAATAARAFHYAMQEAVCDVFEPWEFGTVVRATRYPTYFDLNVVRVEREPRMEAEDLIAFADEALAGLRHRRIDIEEAAAGDPLRAGFEQRGWLHERLVWMRHEEGLPPGPVPAVDVEQVAYDVVTHLRVAWSKEDFPDLDLSDHLDAARDVARRLDAQVFAAFDRAAPVGYAQLERLGRRAEVAQVYVHPEHRGRGIGTALTCTAIDAAGDVDELWIVGDDEGRAKHLYHRLGFRPAWTAVELLRYE